MVKKAAGRSRAEIRRLTHLQSRLWRLNLALALMIFLILAVWWIGIELGFFPQPPAESELLMEQADLFAIGIFALELYSGFRKAQDKAQFLRRKWLEIIVLLPIGTLFRAFKALGELEVLGKARAIVRLEELPVVVPELAVAGRAAGHGLVGIHKWLCHYTVFSDFFGFVMKWRKRLPF